MPRDARRQELIDKVGRLLRARFRGSYRLAFAYYDRQRKDGNINVQELVRLLQDAGIGTWLTRGSWAQAIVASLDTNRDGAISFGEFEAALEEGRKQMS
jgi:Ca2+-binding EF-hand superfamily protein